MHSKLTPFIDCSRNSFQLRTGAGRSSLLLQALVVLILAFRSGSGLISEPGLSSEPVDILGSGDDVRLRISWETESLQNEHLVHFRHYLSPDARRRYIRAALDHDHFDIVPRHRLPQMASDFEVLRTSASVNRLWEHPEVKYVSPHKTVRRLFSVINSTDPSDAGQVAGSTPISPSPVVSTPKKKAVHRDVQQEPVKTSASASKERATTSSEVKQKVKSKKKKKKPVAYHSPEVFLDIVGEKRQQSRKLLRAINTKQVTQVLQADALWGLGKLGL